MTRAFATRQLIDLGSHDPARARLRLQPRPRYEIRLETRMPRVHQQEHRNGAVLSAGKICIARVRLNSSRRCIAAPRITVSGEINKVERRRRAALHPVEVGEPRLARRGARAGHGLPHQCIDQARFADIGPAHQSDLRKPITRKIAGASGACDEFSDNLQRTARRVRFALVTVARRDPAYVSMGPRVARIRDIGDDRRRRDARRQRLGQRDLEHLVHRGHQVQIERVEHVFRDIRQVLLVIAR